MRVILHVYLNRVRMRVYRASKTGKRGSRLFLSVIHPTATKLFHTLPSETATATPLVSIDSNDIMTFEPSASTDHSQEDASSAETSGDEADSTTSRPAGPLDTATFVPKGYIRGKDYVNEFIKEWYDCDGKNDKKYEDLVKRYFEWTMFWCERYLNNIIHPIRVGGFGDRDEQRKAILLLLKAFKALQHQKGQLATSSWQGVVDDDSDNERP